VRASGSSAKNTGEPQVRKGAGHGGRTSRRQRLGADEIYHFLRAFRTEKSPALQMLTAGFSILAHYGGHDLAPVPVWAHQIG